MILTPEILSTDDGSHTLRHPASGETYHSARGAVGEAEHVFIRAGFDALDAPHVRIFEMGFGSGLNALLTLRQARQAGKTVDYHTVERFPIDPQVAARLNFSDDALRSMHAAPWNEPARIDRHFRLTKYNRSLPEIEFDTLFAGTLFELIYFDAFSPDNQPELWTAEIFQKLYARTAPGGILTTYSAKGEVRRALQVAGFTVEKLPGALGKRHMLRAHKAL
jgi:tRNA U34 5-methylaminomethyl-2-thiouridine-forming methyltransferase MnmC